MRAFNKDKPYDQFILEQLAGDLLPIPKKDRQQYLDQITAPAFLSIGPWFDECTDPNKLKLDIVDEQISTLSKAFLAMDFACARCHDHKFDPVPTRDYYAMAGIFRSTRITEKFSEMWKDGRPRLTTDLAMPEELKKKANQFAWRSIVPTQNQRWQFLEAKRKSFNYESSALPDSNSRSIAIALRSGRFRRLQRTQNLWRRSIHRDATSLGSVGKILLSDSGRRSIRIGNPLRLCSTSSRAA